MSTAVEANKAKIAKRVVEVLDYFDDQHREATVMDIVRRYNRPQSSTSELLSSLVDLGLLHKDPYSRSYSLTLRAAMLGSIAQPELVRSGGLGAIIDRLVAQTGLGIAMFGMVGLNVQIFSYKAGAKAAASGIFAGLQERLTDSAPGRLLLSTIAQPRREGMLRRLNAEAAPEKKFAMPQMVDLVQACQRQGCATGPAGFGTAAEASCILLPNQPENQPVALGFIHEPTAHVDPATLLDCLRDAVRRSVSDIEPANVQKLSSAA